MKVYKVKHTQEVVTRVTDWTFTLENSSDESKDFATFKNKEGQYTALTRGEVEKYFTIK